MSHYAATTPTLLRWFKVFNRHKEYREQVRPFGFLLAYQADPQKANDELVPQAVSPYDPDPATAVLSVFDRETGDPVDPEVLKT